MAPVLRGSSKSSAPSVQKAVTPNVSSPGLTVSSFKDRLSCLESLVSQLCSRISSLESENKDLKATVLVLSTPKSPVQSFFTPTPSTVVKPRSVGTRPSPVVKSLQFNDAPESDGEWIIVKNDKNRVIKKVWQSNNFNLNDVVHKNKPKRNNNRNRKRNRNANDRNNRCNNVARNVIDHRKPHVDNRTVRMKRYDKPL